MSELVLAWSTGKDSTASGILAKLHNIKIDKIVTAMPDPFKEELILKEKFEDFMGMEVSIVEGPKFEDFFFRQKKRGKWVGQIYGWPFTISPTCARIMKWEPMAKAVNQDTVFILGIAKGEARKVFSPNRSLLLEYGLTEEDARNLCIEYGLLNPLYERYRRTGCVRCPKQGIDAIRKMKIYEPEKFKWCEEHDKESFVTFKPGISFTDYCVKHGI